MWNSSGSRITLFYRAGKVMPKFMRSLSWIFLLICVPLAQAKPGSLNIVGFDDMSCQAWIRSKGDAEQRSQYIAWIRGVLTGHNYARRTEQVSVISGATVEQFVDRFCRETPAGNFSDAAFRMSDRFSGRNSAILR